MRPGRHGFSRSAAILGREAPFEGVLPHLSGAILKEPLVNFELFYHENTEERIMRARQGLFSKFIVAVLTLLGSVALIASPIWASVPSVPPAAAPGSVSKAEVAEGYGRLPLFFTQNQGQVDPQVKFYTRGLGHAIFFTPEAMVLSLNRASGDVERHAGQKKGAGNQALVQLRPQGIRPGVEILATDPLPGKVNHYQGNDSSKWRTETPTFKSVLYREAYPGIDLKFYGTRQQQVEYDLIIKPGADPKQVKFRYQGIKALKVGKAGDLIITLPGGGKLVQQKPVIYQEINGQRVSREGKFRLRSDKRSYGFDLASYDTRYPLIIDPVVLVYSTYLGGNAWESGNAIAVDGDGSAYVAGTTQSSDFPVVTPTAPSPGPAFGAGATENAFVTKFDPAGNTLVYSTYLGGNTADIGLAVAVDAAGNAYVAGETYSSNFPVSAGVFQTALRTNAASNAFVTKLDPNGTLTLGYSTYLGGGSLDNGLGSTDSPAGIKVDADGNAYVVGTTNATNFPTQGAFQPALGGVGAINAFVAELNPTGSALVFSTYLGGEFSDTAWGIDIDTTGNVYVAGETTSLNFPKTNASSLSGFSDAFVTKLNPTGSALVYSTYLGGAGTDGATGGIAVNRATGEAYIAGYTDSTDFPVTAGAFQTALGGAGATNAFVTKFDPTGTSVYATYLGGDSSDVAWFIAVDASGNAYVTGETSSSNFPRRGPFQNTLKGAINAFVTKLNTGGTGLHYSTYLGGTATDYGFGIAVNSLSTAYVAGYSTSTDFPTLNPYQATPALTSIGAAFVTKLLWVNITPIYLPLLLDDNP